MTGFRFSGRLRHTFLAFVPILICRVADKHSAEPWFTMAVLKHLFWWYKNRAAVWRQNLFYFQDRKLQCSQSGFARCLQPKCFWSFPVLWYSIPPNPIRSPDTATRSVSNVITPTNSYSFTCTPTKELCERWKQSIVLKGVMYLSLLSWLYYYVFYSWWIMCFIPVCIGALLPIPHLNKRWQEPSMNCVQCS